ncbi:N-acetyltransferase [Brucepastera parasyntrophica]|uniref:GNAT family N-acetyltransferase n=1 Tax=Brucepastera parasyntrophica TaxID=2880008 RepID=UPI00210A9BF9|nr:N-acetyltransferase [Brucepastera parasyntrophica]ULQ60223.1 N-acetyltransferase [Brucepastera parasyntrophica]
MQLLIRNELPADYRETELVTRDAFWDIYRPGCDEHLIVHKARKKSSFISELDFVACDGKKIIGNIIYTKAKIVSAEGEEYTLVCIGPLSVLPEYQNKGVGSQLIHTSLEKARELDFRAVTLFGDPKYYRRFGFVNAKNYNITTKDGDNFEEFMILALSENGLDGVTGKMYQDSVFDVNPSELVQFEKQFPHRKKM